VTIRTILCPKVRRPEKPSSGFSVAGASGPGSPDFDLAKHALHQGGGFSRLLLRALQQGMCLATAHVAGALHVEGGVDGTVGTVADVVCISHVRCPFLVLLQDDGIDPGALEEDL